VIAVDDSDPFDLGAGLELARLALDLQILDQRDVVAMVELIAIRIGNDPLARCGLGPLVATNRALMTVSPVK